MIFSSSSTLDKSFLKVRNSIMINVSEIKAEALKIEGPASIPLGDSVSLVGAFTPSDTTDQTIKWSVNDPSIANISDDGVFTANNVGTATVTATQKDVSATYMIDVLPINVEEIIITTNAEDTVKKEDTINFFAEVLPKNATYPEITWSVSDPEIASIDANGVLTALKSGKVSVIAASADGYCSEYEITVSSPITSAISTVGIAGVGAAVISAIKKKKK